MRFLLDNNVLSELRKGARCAPKVRRWFDAQNDEDIRISVITLGEISAGIAQIALRDSTQAQHLELWLSQMKKNFAGSILPVTEDIADCWGRLSPRERLPAADALIAATALQHGLTVVTRNVADFERSGARILNPWE